MKKKLILMLVAGIAAATALIGGTMAGFNTEAQQQGVAQITTKSLSVGWEEKVAAEETEESELVPGGMMNLSRTVVNDAKDGYDFYTRVTIYKSWGNDELDGSKLHVYNNEIELVMENADALNESDWILWYADDEQVVLYYRKPLASGESTTDVITGVRIDENISNSYANADVSVEFEVDAVQKIAAEQAMVSEWGVYPVFDEEGNIVSISE